MCCLGAFIVTCTLGLAVGLGFFQLGLRVHRGRWGTVDTFLHFQPLLLYFKSKQAQICHTIKQLYIHNIMSKHENNAFQKKFYNQFQKSTFSVECAPCMGHTWSVNQKLGYMHCIMFRWYPRLIKIMIFFLIKKIGFFYLNRILLI